MSDDNYPLFRHTDPATSREAAEVIKPVTGKIALEVLRVARMCEPRGFIDDDLKRAFPEAAESSHRKRRCELVLMGKLRATGEERLNRRGRKEMVWRLASPNGHDTLAKDGEI